MKKKAVKLPKLSDLKRYRFDTSQYAIIKGTVLRDSRTGLLMSPKAKNPS
jgi:hypothetical protein